MCQPSHVFDNDTLKYRIGLFDLVTLYIRTVEKKTHKFMKNKSMPTISDQEIQLYLACMRIHVTNMGL